jgi:Na+-transporting methylmalonyl-CoA/oxaloacetate decarboxylase gamma subunit
MKYVHDLFYGGQVTSIGLFFVFIALAALIFCIWLMSKIIRAFDGRGKNDGDGKPLPTPDEPAPTPVDMIEEASEEIAPDIIAAIAAAISAFTDSGKQLVIRSVRRSGNWARAARAEQVSRF